MFAVRIYTENCVVNWTKAIRT